MSVKRFEDFNSTNESDGLWDAYYQRQVLLRQTLGTLNKLLSGYLADSPEDVSWGSIASMGLAQEELTDLIEHFDEDKATEIRQKFVEIK